MKKLIQIAAIIMALLGATFAVATAQNPAIVPAPDTPNIWADRWKEKLARVKQGDIDLILVGDSITHAWDNPENQPIWSAYYDPRKAVSLGYSGARTENILWMLENGEVDGIKPKVAVVMIGTNNTDGVHFPVANTPEQIAAGIVKIVQTLRAKLPDTKILLLRIFPRNNLPGTGEAGGKASDIARKIADNRTVFYLDINKIYLKPDGAIDPALMPDLLHPNPVGNLLWAEAMEPMLERLMGRPANTAAIPAEKCEQDFYDWYVRHEAAKAQIKQGPVDLVFIGDSITHMFGGLPTSNLTRGASVWDRYYGDRHTVNLGFGYDRTQQVLWRLENGEFEGIHPKVAVMMIGTNNLAPHAARANTNEEIVAGIRAICDTIRRKSPRTKILLLGIFPRGKNADELYRVRIAQINRELAKLNGRDNITFLDIGVKFLDANGAMLPDVTVDMLHPNEKGYAIWAEAMEPTLARLLGQSAK
jgi:lysophospholipase L1-like esterase